MTAPLRRQDASLNLWDSICKPIKVYQKKCENCDKIRSVEFNYQTNNKLIAIYACSLTCFKELQKK